MRGMIDIAPGASATDGDCAGCRIDTSVFDQSQVDDQAIIANSQAAGIVSATANGEKQIIFSRKIYRADDVRHIRAARDQARLFVYHPVVHFTGFIIILIVRFDQSPAQICFEIGNRIFVEHGKIRLGICVDHHCKCHVVKMSRSSIFIEMTVVSAVGCGSHGDVSPG
jgi:hypothetical protein